MTQGDTVQFFFFCLKYVILCLLFESLGTSKQSTNGTTEDATGARSCQCDVRCRPQEPRNPRTQSLIPDGLTKSVRSGQWDPACNWKHMEHFLRLVQDQTGQARPVSRLQSLYPDFVALYFSVLSLVQHGEEDLVWILWTVERDGLT